MASAPLSVIQAAKAMMLTESSGGMYLARCGQNSGVPRFNLVSDDDMYRRIVQALSWQPKAVPSTVYWLMQAVFGSQADIIAANQRPWAVYEVQANELVLEVPLALTATSNQNASYLHGVSGLADNSDLGGSQPSFHTPGDITRALASPAAFAGLTVELETSHNTFTSYTIASVSYNASANLSTVTCTANIANVAGVLFHIDIPGDNSTSYRGDYLPSSVSEAAGAPNPSVADRVYLSGDGLLEIVTYYLNLLVLASGIVLRIERI